MFQLINQFRAFKSPDTFPTTLQTTKSFEAKIEHFKFKGINCFSIAIHFDIVVLMFPYYFFKFVSEFDLCEREREKYIRVHGEIIHRSSETTDKR